MSEEIINPNEAFDILIASSQPEEIDNLKFFFEEGYADAVIDAASSDYLPPPSLPRKQRLAWELGYRSMSFPLKKKTST